MPKIRDQNEYNKVMKGLTQCPFCNLKDEYFLSSDGGMVLTMNLFPYIDYHLMIVPRRHIENLRDLTNAEFLSFRNLSYVGTKILHKKGIKDLNILYREGPSSDRSLGHLHIHIIPYKNNVIAKNPQALKYSVKESTSKLKKLSDYSQDKLNAIKARNFNGNII